MWISREEYGRLKACEAVQRDNIGTIAAKDSTIEWMRVRLNQVEAERASLLSRVTGVPTFAPAITRASDAAPVNRPIEGAGAPGSILDGLSALFEDVGDEMAAKIGASHDDLGALKFDR